MQTDAAARSRSPAAALGIAVLFFALALLTRLPTFFRSVLDWDESLYFMMAQSWRSGHLPYTALWDNKPIGLYAIFAAFQTVFGETIFSMRIAAAIAVATTAIVICGIYRRLEAHRVQLPDLFGPFAGILYIVCSVFNGGMAANAEILFAPFVCLALLVALPDTTSSRRIGERALMAGALMGMAAIVKYNAGFETPVVLLALGHAIARRAPRRGGTNASLRPYIAAGALYAVGLFVPIMAPMLLYWAAGRLPDFIEANILANLRRLGEPLSIPHILRGLIDQILLWGPLYLAAALLLLHLATALRRRSPPLLGDREPLVPVLVLVWIAGAFVGAGSVQLQVVHHYLQPLPALCVTTAWVLGRLLSSSEARLAGRSLPVLAFIITGPVAGAAGIIKDTLKPVVMGGAEVHGWLRDTPAQIAAAIRPELARVPDETIYVFDYEKIIYPLAGVPPPTRYADPFFIVSRWGSDIAGIAPDREVSAIMARHPLFIITRAPDPTAERPAEGYNASVFAALDRVLGERYKVWKVYKEALVYRRRGA